MLVRLKDNLDAYHERRAEDNGMLYILEGRSAPMAMRMKEGPVKMCRDMFKAKSLATGATCTFRAVYLEFPYAS
jgi:hypothetical protein